MEKDIQDIKSLSKKYQVVGKLFRRGNGTKTKKFFSFKCVKCNKISDMEVFYGKKRNSSFCIRCGRKEKAKNSISKTKLYNVLASMISRCHNKNDKEYFRYGKREILVCKQWRENRKSFLDWAKSNGYKQGLSIDRINNNMGYFPNNCRWTTAIVQSRNTALLSSRNTSGYRGVSLCKNINKFRARITVNYKHINILSDKCRIKCAYAYDDYIRKNSLEHTKNFS